MTNLSQTNLTEPAQVDWDNYGSKGYTPPPPALGPDGKPIVYYGVASAIVQDEPDQVDGNNFLQFKLDPIKIVQSGTADGYEIRFTRASTRPYTILQSDGTRVPKKGNPNKLADYVKAAGASAKPQINAEYVATVQAVSKKPFPFTIEWEAYNKDTGERVKGYNAFPEDPDRPGQRKSILHAGDVVNVIDSKGNLTGQTSVVKSDVLFVNARLRYFVDPKKGAQR